MDKLYVKFKKPKTIVQFIKLFYSNLMKNHGTCYAVTTYYDKECKKLHCDRNWRGFDDLLILVKTYYPSTNEKILLKRLLDIVILKYNLEIVMHFGICGSNGILRVMPYCSKSARSTISDRKPENSKYNWIDLFKLININNNEELLNFQEKRLLKEQNKYIKK
jgi:hypothetical protein